MFTGIPSIEIEINNTAAIVDDYMTAAAHAGRMRISNSAALSDY
jgi:hypothetical protein